jgi:methylated-DNA-[protein]-cysteine S-methyltransferase
MSDLTPGISIVFPSELGWIGLTGNKMGLTQLAFGYENGDDVPVAAKLTTSADPKLPRWMEAAVSLLKAYAAGEPVDLGEIPLAIEHRTPFEKRVREQLRRIGYGKTISYGALAIAAGAPGAARAVGNIMAKNPLPLVIPCHRVLAAGGRLGGFSAPAGTEMKRHLLRMEQGQASHCPESNSRSKAACRSSEINS